jgi:hypothetical protein
LAQRGDFSHFGDGLGRRHGDDRHGRGPAGLDIDGRRLGLRRVDAHGVIARRDVIQNEAAVGEDLRLGGGPPIRVGDDASGQVVPQDFLRDPAADFAEFGRGSDQGYKPRRSSGS